ncbi:GNAT family N-acetyltransferase [Streptomyces sp. NPDC002787]
MDVENLSGFQVARAASSDWAALAKIDSVAAWGDHARGDSIRRWCEQGVVLMARDSSGPLGYSVLEYSFFEQGFVTMLMVAPHARRRGVGARLLTAVENVCTTAKLFTSTNVSHHPVQQLLQRVGWHPVGLLAAWAGVAVRSTLKSPPPRRLVTARRRGGGLVRWVSGRC